MSDLVERYSCSEHGKNIEDGCLACEIYADMKSMVEEIERLRDMQTPCISSGTGKDCPDAPCENCLHYQKAEIERLRNPWIPVSERLPEESEVVLVIRSGHHEPFIGNMLWELPTFEETFDAFMYWDDARNDGQVWDDVTHWMPLPQPPKDTQESS